MNGSFVVVFAGGVFQGFWILPFLSFKFSNGMKRLPDREHLADEKSTCPQDTSYLCTSFFPSLTWNAPAF